MSSPIPPLLISHPTAVAIKVGYHSKAGEVVYIPISVACVHDADVSLIQLIPIDISNIIIISFCILLNDYVGENIASLSFLLICHINLVGPLVQNAKRLSSLISLFAGRIIHKIHTSA